jgi:polyisoprenoid-binding protein YceI
VKRALCVLVLLATVKSEALEKYRLDSGNTQVSFAVKRLGIQWVWAHFEDISGEFVLDRNGLVSRVDVSVGIASLDCNEPRWNDRLRSPEWLDAQRYPRMIYHSNRIEMGVNEATASGELTLHGVTRPVVLNVSLPSCTRAGSCQFSAHGRIKRSEFGLPHTLLTGGDPVEIYISGAVSGGVP